MEKFTNEKRNRYYGLRIGDRISYSPFNQKIRYGTVIEFGFTDNNAVYVKFDGEKKPEKVVAEWCTLVKKIEDIEMKTEDVNKSKIDKRGIKKIDLTTDTEFAGKFKTADFSKLKKDIKSKFGDRLQPITGQVSNPNQLFNYGSTYPDYVSFGISIKDMNTKDLNIIRTIIQDVVDEFGFNGTSIYYYATPRTDNNVTCNISLSTKIISTSNKRLESKLTSIIKRLIKEEIEKENYISYHIVESSVATELSSLMGVDYDNLALLIQKLDKIVDTSKFMEFDESQELDFYFPVDDKDGFFDYIARYIEIFDEFVADNDFNSSEKYFKITSDIRDIGNKYEPTKF